MPRRLGSAAVTRFHALVTGPSHSTPMLGILNPGIDERCAMYRSVLLAIALSASSSVPSFAQGALVKVDGSSTVYPVTEAVAEDFQKAERGATKVTVGISGTGGGFKKFCRGEIDVSNASRP